MSTLSCLFILWVGKYGAEISLSLLPMKSLLFIPHRSRSPSCAKPLQCSQIQRAAPAQAEISSLGFSNLPRKKQRGAASSGAACICAARLMRPSWVPAPRRVAPCAWGLWGWDFGTSGSPGCATSGKPRVCHPKWDLAGLGFSSPSATFQGRVWEGPIFPSSAFVIASVRLLGLCRLKC